MQDNYITNQYQITCNSGRVRTVANALEKSMMERGIYQGGGVWRALSADAKAQIMARAVERVHRAEAAPAPVLRVVALSDNGLTCAHGSATAKIALYVMAKFERDDRPWYNAYNKTVYIWDEAHHRRFRALMYALGFKAAYKLPKSVKQPTREELYLARLLASDLGIDGLAQYADIFGGRAESILDAERDAAKILIA